MAVAVTVMIVPGEILAGNVPVTVRMAPLLAFKALVVLSQIFKE
jgi:hypothetical protein